MAPIPVRPFPWLRAALLGGALVPACASAQDYLMPYAGVQLEYDTNVFALPSD